MSNQPRIPESFLADALEYSCQSRSSIPDPTQQHHFLSSTAPQKLCRLDTAHSLHDPCWVEFRTRKTLLFIPL